MNRFSQFLSSLPRVAVVASLALIALAGTSCRFTPQPCEKGPLIDTSGASAEQARIDLQWLAIQGKFDSASTTSGGIQARRLADGRLDSAIARYGDSTLVDGGAITSKSGCLDWHATWQTGRFDRSALATAWVRALVADSVGVVEWSLSDTTELAWKLHVLYTRPGPDGGSLDSTVLTLAPDRVQVERTGASIAK